MRISRFSMAALMLAVGLASATVMAATPAPATPPATAPAKTGSVSGKVVDKDGKPAANLQVRAIDAALAAAPGGGARGGRGGRGGRGARGGAPAPTTDENGAFTLKDVPVGKVVVTASTPFAGRGAAPATPPATAPVFLRGQSDPVDVTENTETKLPSPIKVEEVAMPAGRGGRGAGGGGGGAPRGAGGGGGGAGGGN